MASLRTGNQWCGGRCERQCSSGRRSVKDNHLVAFRFFFQAALTCLNIEGIGKESNKAYEVQEAENGVLRVSPSVTQKLPFSSVKIKCCV